MDTVDVRSLLMNESTADEKDLESCRGGNNESRNWSKNPFPIDKTINRIVVLYDGNLELLRAEALVNPTDENLTHLQLVNRLAGPELEAYIKKKIRYCPTGDVRVSPGFKSNFQRIIHAVPPKYQAKYKTAVETSLFNTYFRVLETMIEKKIRTVIMPTLSTPKCNLPIEENCKMQFRVIRRILEKRAYDFDRIVILVGDADSLKHLFFSHFPRTSIDEEIACYKLDPIIGGSNGEPITPGREIRIKWPLVSLAN